MHRVVMIILATCSFAWSADAIDDEVATFERDRDQLQTELEAQITELRRESDSDLAELRERSIRNIERAVKRAARNGDVATAAKGWKAVLGMDSGHEEAREFFTAMGTLDNVLAEVTGSTDEAGAGDVDLLAPDEPAAAGMTTPVPDVMAQGLAAMRRQQVTIEQSHACCEINQIANGGFANHMQRNPFTSLPEGMAGLKLLNMVDGTPLNIRGNASTPCIVVALVRDDQPRSIHQLERDGWNRIQGVAATASLSGYEGESTAEVPRFGMRRSPPVEQRDHFRLQTYYKQFPAGPIWIQTQGWTAIVH